MSTINFDAIPAYTREYLADATLRAVRETLSTPEGRALIARKTEERKRKEAEKK